MERISWIDIEKGLAIILMVIGHSALPQNLSNFIFAFHMPVFFILSGICSNYDKDNFVIFTKKRLKSIILPFVAYSIIVLILCTYLGVLNVESLILHGWGGFALWFIPVFFVSSLLAKIICQHIPKTTVILVILLALLGGVISRLSIRLPWSICSIPYSASLIIIGNKYKTQLIRKIEHINAVQIVILSFVVYAISYYFPLDIAWNKVSPVFLTLFAAVLGTIMLGGISKYMTKLVPKTSTIFIKIGKETYVILAFSQVLTILPNILFGWMGVANNIFMILCIISIVVVKNIYVKKYILKRKNEYI